MKTLSMTNNTSYELEEDDFQKVLEAVESGAKHVVIQGDFLMVASIVAIQDSGLLEEAARRKNGEYQCVHGHWHQRWDKCYGHDSFDRLPAKTDHLLKSDNRSEEEQYKSARKKAQEIRDLLAEKMSMKKKR